MRNMSAERGLGGDANWPHLYFVHVRGTNRPGAVAVLEVEPASSVVQVGFKNGGNAQRLRVPIETVRGRFGMRVGTGDVEYFVLPLGADGEVRLRLVEVTEEHDTRYVELPIY